MSFLLEIVWYSKHYKDLPRLHKTAAGLSSAEHILQIQGKVTLFNKMPALCFLTVTLIWTFIYLFIYCILISLRDVPLSKPERIRGLALSSC